MLFAKACCLLEGLRHLQNAEVLPLAAQRSNADVHVEDNSANVSDAAGNSPSKSRASRSGVKISGKPLG
jgi:hypothetical protein